MENRIEDLCARLAVEDPRSVEIESKRRVLSEEADDIQRFLLKRKKVTHQRSSFFFDQFLDTPRMELLRRGASLRLRYKRNGAEVYLQYKGPGFRSKGLLYRSELSTGRLLHVLLEESHHDIVHFKDTSVREILSRHAEPSMERTMRRHLGPRVIERITVGPILCVYRKEKFLMELGNSFLEPSVDRVFAFHINRKGLHPLSSFCEYENEIKAPGSDLESKLKRTDELLSFDKELSKRFDMPPERHDKYHRCASFFA